MSIILDIKGPLMSCRQLRREPLSYGNAFVHIDWRGELDLGLLRLTVGRQRAPRLQIIRCVGVNKFLNGYCAPDFCSKFPALRPVEVENINITHAKGVPKSSLRRRIVGDSGQELEVRVGCELLAASCSRPEGDRAGLIHGPDVCGRPRHEAGCMVSDQPSRAFACVCPPMVKSGGKGH